MNSSPILDLAGLTLEVNHLARGVRFYSQVLGLDLVRHDEAAGVAEFAVNPHQTLTLWQPVTRQANDARLAPLRPRGASHIHYAWQIELDDLEPSKALLDAHGLEWQEINLGTEDRPDWTLYFFDPFGHGLELRAVDRADARQPHFPPMPIQRPAHALPVMGLREVALAFSDYAAMKERLPRAYGFALAKEQEDRDFAQFTLGPQPEPDGNGTPRRWLYAWDPQVGLADMLGGDHALVRFYADVDAVAEAVKAAGLPSVQDEQGLAVRDPEGHVFEFVAP
ncbi:VOC family protein [Deinococcus marmoris]|uniref:Fosfomycin resistance protein FofB n=1 Tax=Deinococcus marmoris TaxID=249408 RepID=A0A1U7NU67_9DEIO|nr:VOC family protein [Deinococcus marmoris]OLV16451.1 Fosfomycin resistance protein FofB [Deinococcus marmoris]